MPGYMVLFGRVGRSYDVPDLIVPVEEIHRSSDHDLIAEAVCRHITPHLTSPYFTVTLDLDTEEGWIGGGGQSDTFTVIELNESRA
jgi:hypothetical protein